MEFFGFILFAAIAVGAFFVIKKRRAAKAADSAATAAPTTTVAQAAAPSSPVIAATKVPSTASVTIYYDPTCPNWPSQKAEYLKKYPNAVFVPMSGTGQ